MKQAIISAVTAAAVLMQTLLCCSAHFVCSVQGGCKACECCHEPAPDFPAATPWLKGDFAGFACCHRDATRPTGGCEHAPDAPRPCQEHHNCDCVLAAPDIATSSRDIKANHVAVVPLAGLVDGHLTVAEPFFRLAPGTMPLRYGSLRAHLALAVLLR